MPSNPSMDSGHNHVDLDALKFCGKTIPNTTFRALEPVAVRCWALPVSFAITKGITVVFFSSAY